MRPVRVCDDCGAIGVSLSLCRDETVLKLLCHECRENLRRRFDLGSPSDAAGAVSDDGGSALRSGS